MTVCGHDRAAGRSLVDLLMIYPSQASQYEQLSMHAPSVPAWIPDTGRPYPYFYPAGLLSTAAAMLCFCFLVYRSQAKITPALLITRSTVSVMLVAFLLPKMHERYFFPADVFTILLAFYPLRHYLTAIGMGLTSFFAYAPTLFGVTPIPIAVRAAAVLIPLLTLV